MQDAVDRLLPQQQAGFRHGKSCTVYRSYLYLEAIIEKATEAQYCPEYFPYSERSRLFKPVSEANKL